MQRIFNKWFIAALVVVLSLSAFSFMAYKKTRMVSVSGKPCCASQEEEEVMPWGGISIQFPANSLH